MSTPVNSSSSQAAIANTINGVARDLQNLQTVQVFKDDTGTRRVILDKDGLRTSQTGVDVFSATNDQLSFNSNNNVFKIVQSGTSVTPTVTSSKAGTSQYGSYTGTTTVVAHDLGYIPAVLAFAYDGSNVYVQLPWTFQNGVTSNSFTTVTYNMAVDATNVYITADVFTYNASVTTTGYNVKYYLLQETAN